MKIKRKAAKRNTEQRYGQRKIFNLNLSETQYRSDANRGQRAACFQSPKEDWQVLNGNSIPKDDHTTATQKKSSLRYVIIGYSVCIYVHVAQINTQM